MSKSAEFTDVIGAVQRYSFCTSNYEQAEQALAIAQRTFEQKKAEFEKARADLEDSQKRIRRCCSVLTKPVD